MTEYIGYHGWTYFYKLVFTSVLNLLLLLLFLLFKVNCNAAYSLLALTFSLVSFSCLVVAEWCECIRFLG